jgi:hypothetical protein
MAHSREYIDAMFKAAKAYLPAWVWKHLHARAFPSSGGVARHRPVEKQMAPISRAGLTVDALFTQLSLRGEQYSKTESEYVEPTTDGMVACGACRFYLRDPQGSRGLCQLVTGPIAWFGTCQFYIGAQEEAVFALSGVIAKQEGFQIQTIIFPKDRWTLARARSWLTDHDFTQDKIDETERSYRFRQLDPGQFVRIRPICLMPNGAPPNLEDCRVLAFGGQIAKADTKKGEKALTEKDIDEEIDKAVHEEYGGPDRRRKRRRMKSIDKEIPILKIDHEKQIVYGVVLDPYIVDTQGDWIPPAEVEKTAHEWMKESRRIGLRHRSEADAEPVETFLMPYPSKEDYQKAMDGQPHRVIKFKMGDGFVHSGSWVLGTEIKDAKTWELVKSGELGSYSIGGHGERTEVPLSVMPEITELIEADWSKAA